MVNRRSVINGGLLAGFAAIVPGQQTRSAAQTDADSAVAKAIADLNGTIQRGMETSPELARIREQQRTFLKANQKFPDFIEVGINVWESVSDWHIRHQQPLSVTRTAEGRYAMTVGFTTLLLRPDFIENYVGLGMDAR